jgi:hypothetical protein
MFLGLPSKSKKGLSATAKTVEHVSSNTRVSRLLKYFKTCPQSFPVFIYSLDLTED